MHVVIFPHLVLGGLVILIELSEVEAFAERGERFVWFVLPPLKLCLFELSALVDCWLSFAEIFTESVEVLAGHCLFA